MVLVPNSNMLFQPIMVMKVYIPNPIQPIEWLGYENKTHLQNLLVIQVTYKNTREQIKVK